VVFTNTRHESNHNQYPTKTTEQTAIASFYFIFEFISVSVDTTIYVAQKVTVHAYYTYKFKQSTVTKLK
jgi:hypothetical protein